MSKASDAARKHTEDSQRDVDRMAEHVRREQERLNAEASRRRGW